MINKPKKRIENKRFRKVVSNWEVAHLWANESQSEARTQTGNFSFNGPDLYSYSTCIATIKRIKGKRVYLFDHYSYSSTTGQHRSQGQRATNGTHVFSGNLGGYGKRRIDAVDIALSYLEEIAASIEKLKTCHYSSMPCQVKSILWACNQLETLLAVFKMKGKFLKCLKGNKNLLAVYKWLMAFWKRKEQRLPCSLRGFKMGLFVRKLFVLVERLARCPYWDADLIPFLRLSDSDKKEIEKKQKEIAAAKRKAERVRLERMEREKKESAENLAKWRNREIDRCPYLHGKTALRLSLSGEVVQTSLGMAITVKGFLVAMRFWKLGTLQGKMVTSHNGTQWRVDTANEDGIRIGCHNITKEELENMWEIIRSESPMLGSLSEVAQ